MEVSSITSRSQSSGLSSLRLKPPLFGSTFKQPVDGLGFEAGRFTHALGGAAGWSAEQESHCLGGQDAQYRFDDGGLANAGTAGNHQHLGRQGELDGASLAFRKSKADPCFDPWQGFVGIDPGPWEWAAH